MLASLTIRQAVVSDAAVIRSCIEKAYSFYIQRIGRPPGPMREDYSHVLHTHPTYVAEVDHRLFGVLVLKPQQASLLLDNVAVLPQYQKLGFGRQLLEFAESEGRQQGYSRIELYTNEQMLENIGIYKHLGYEETLRRTEFGYKRVYMQKFIGIENKTQQVGVFAQMPEFSRKELDLGPREFYSNPRLVTAGTLEVMEKYGFDCPYLDFDVYTIEPEGLGMDVVWSDESMPDLNYARPIVADKGDAEKIQTPDFDTVGRFAHVLEMYREYQKLTQGVLPPFRCSAPFTLAANIRGTSDFLVDIHMDPEFAHGLLERTVEEVLAPWLLRVKKEFPGLTEIGADDALGSLPIVSPEIMRDWIVPAFEHLRRLVGPEVYVPNWVGERYLSDPEILLDMKRQVCPGFIRAQDPDVAILGPSLFKAYADRQAMDLTLGVGAAFLDSASPEEVEERINQYLQIGAPGGGLTIYLCTLSTTTNPANVRAAVRAVRDYNRERTAAG